MYALIEHMGVKLILIMGKAFLLSVLFTVALASCDPGCRWNYTIKNNSSSTINVEITEGPKNFTIAPNTEQSVESVFRNCNGKWPGDRFNGEEFTVMIGVITIDGNTMPDIIWKSRYWTYRSEEHGGTYTLVVTDQLINDFIETTNTNQ